MTVLIAVENDAGETAGQCDARCYNAKHERCKCVCGGVNHGVGLALAESNTRARDDWETAVVTVTGVRPRRIRFSRSVLCLPLPGMEGDRMPEAIAPETEIWYAGRRDPGVADPSPVMIEDADGNLLGAVSHVVKHSPTGMGWGYAGSGAADCARSILIAALGPDSRCTSCLGTERVAWRRNGPEDETGGPVPYSPEDHSDDGLFEIPPCPEKGFTCDQGYQVSPSVYQAFKFEFVAVWGDQFRISRSEVLAWVRPRMEAPSI